MLQQRDCFLGVVILGCTGLLLAAGVGMASSDRPTPMRAGSAVERTDHLTDKRRGDAPIRREMVGSPSGCIDDQSLNWVTTVRPLPECWSFGGFHYADDQDINRDGSIDFVNPVWGVQLLKGGSPIPPQCFSYLYSTSWDGSAVEVSYSCIATSGLLVEYAVTQFPGQSVQMGEIGWRDLDGDADLDMIVELRVNDAWENTSWVWLENTGYEANDGLAADLNGDGAVDGKDLTALLAAWTG